MEHSSDVDEVALFVMEPCLAVWITADDLFDGVHAGRYRAAPAQRSATCESWSRSRVLANLPTLVLGISSTKMISSGSPHFATRSERNSRSSSAWIVSRCSDLG